MKESEDPIIAYLALHLQALDDEYDKLKVMCGGLRARNKTLVDLLTRCKTELLR
jgi:hypothetical protein